MLKLTKTGIGLLTKQYRSVLRKCLLLNFSFLIISNETYSSIVIDDGGWVTQANGEHAITIGINSSANGNRSFAAGADAHSDTSYSVALGAASITSDDYTVSVGSNSLKRRIVNVAAGQNDNDVVILKQLNDALNYYYTFRVDERTEVIDYTSFFQKDFLTLQKVDLQSKNPTHLGAFSKCDEACPRPSERFVSSLSREQMFKNNASVDAGTSRHCLRQFGDVLANLLKNTAAKNLRISEFMNEEVRHA